MARTRRARRARTTRRAAGVRRKAPRRTGRRIRFDPKSYDRIHAGMKALIGTASALAAKYHTTPAKNDKKFGRGGSWGGSRGTLHGPFPKPRRLKAISSYAKYGARYAAEHYGTITMKDCAYFGVMSAPQISIGHAVGLALIRYVMRKHYELEYSDPQQAIIPGSEVHPLKAIQFVAQTTSADGNVSFNVPATGKYVLGTNSIQHFADWFRTEVFDSIFFNYVSDVGNSNSLYGYRLIEGNPDGTQGPTVTVDTVKLHVYTSMRFYIQNTTPADAGGMEADAIDANPIQGKLFRFSNRLPIMRDAVNQYLDITTDNQVGGAGDGLITCSSNPTHTFRGVPTSDIFRNCTGSSRVLLQPGGIKHFTIRFKYNGYINKLMNGLGNTNSSVATAGLSSYGKMGTSCLIALEKVVRTGTQDDVVVNYHVDKEFGAYFGFKKRQVMRKVFTLSTLNVDPTNEEAA